MARKNRFWSALSWDATCFVPASTSTVGAAFTMLESTMTAAIATCTHLEIIGKGSGMETKACRQLRPETAALVLLNYINAVAVPKAHSDLCPEFTTLAPHESYANSYEP